MKLLCHLIKFNFIFSKMRIAIMSVICFFIVLIGHFFNSDPSAIGEDILSYSTSLIFFVIVGKMSLRNNSMFDIKHLLGFPLSKSQIVLHKSIADVVHFFPVSIVWIYGLSLKFPEYHTIAALIIFHTLLVMLNMVSLNKRIDFARIQHSSASFKNSFLFLNKYLNLYIQIGLFALIIALILAITKVTLWREYSLFVFTCLLVILAYFSTLKMLKDETLSYFIARRDIKRMGWKFIVVTAPLVLLFSFQKGLDHTSDLANEEAGFLEKFGQQIHTYKAKMDGKAGLLKIANADPSEIEKYLEQKKSPVWKAEVMGGKLPHMVAGKGNIASLKKIVEFDPTAVNVEGTIKKRTPLFTALNSCHIETADYLLFNGANINHQDIDGNSPIMFAAKSGCIGGVLLLKERGADLTLKNKEKETIDQLVEKSGVAKYWSYNSDRNLASENKTKKD